MGEHIFILILQRIGYSEEAIATVIDYRKQEQTQGILRPWEEYLPEGFTEDKEAILNYSIYPSNPW